MKAIHASRRREALIHRVAHRHLEAGAKEWLQWIVQPVDVLRRNAKAFISGPIDDAMDTVLQEIAPQLVEKVAEHEIDSDIDEFMEGAVKGRWDADKGYLADPDGPTDDWNEGYEWGYAHPDQDPSRMSPRMKRRLVEEAVGTLRGQVTERVVLNSLRTAWNAVNPMTTFRAILQAVKKYGWKVGLVIGLIETVETFVLPAALIAITGDPKMSVAGMLPLSEILYAVVFRFLGRVPGEVDELDADGHLDWYQEKFGPVRLAMLT